MILAVKKMLIVGLCVLTINSYAQSEYELVQIVTQRNVLMHKMLDSYWPLIAVKNGKSTDLDEARNAATEIATAMRESVTLFLEGTAKGEVPVSRSKPEVWTNTSDFYAASDELIAAAESLVDASETGDADAFVKLFPAFEAACIQCHGFKPSSGGKFRFEN